MRNVIFALAAAAILLESPTLAQNAVDIGLAAAAKNEVIVVGEANRGLRSGDTIFQNQHIRTGRNSAAQLLFRDETALTMGPNAALILDKAVYDPDKHTSEITVRAVSGAFRFISGSSPTGSYSINTPAGTVGIRGTWIDMLVAGETVRIIVRRGKVRFCNTGGQCANMVAGYELRASNRHIGQQTKMSHETVESIVALWFTDTSDANLGNLAPGAGPGNDEQGYAGVGKPFWWLDGIYRGYGREFERNSVTGLTLPSDGTTPPGSGPPAPPPSPPSRPPTNIGFPPITNPGVGVPPGLKKDTLPPGLANRGPEMLPPGQQKKN